MAIKLRLLGTTYEIPENGDAPSWGEAITSYLQAVNEYLLLIIDPNDILPTEETILNNQPTDTLIKGLLFNSALVRSGNIVYSIFRKTDTQTVVETNTLLLNYEADAPMGEKWKFTSNSNDSSSGVLISVDDSGQFYYKSNDLTGANYEGSVVFQAKILLK